MPKPYTFPTLYDNVNQISITKFKEWGYLKSNLEINRTLHWSVRGTETAVISIFVNTNTSSPFIELSYRYKDKPIRYRVSIMSIESNIGNGKIWYFICPKTYKRCRKLYLVDGHFLHREAVKGCLYISQKRSKKEREIDKVYGAYFNKEELYKQLNTKHLKKTYNGQPTKRYLKIQKQLEQAERINYYDIMSLLMM